MARGSGARHLVRALPGLPVFHTCADPETLLSSPVIQPASAPSLVITKAQRIAE